MVLVALDVVLRAYLRRPFWYDEIWRGHFVGEPLGSFWSELARANTPSAVGWVVIERLGGDLLGWHAWVLRLPGFVALPLLGIGIVLLAARFTGPVPAAFAALWICLNSTLLDLGTQLKPYTVEMLAAVVAVLLWMGAEGGTARGAGSAGVSDGRAGGGLDHGRLARRTAAGLVSLLSVPAVFVIAPLVAADLVTAMVRARRASRADAGGALAAGGWRALEALPALVLTGANTLFFVGHQSSQRLGHYWDAQFLAGRGLGGGLSFIGGQLRDFVTGTPPGIDRYDPSLLHPPTDGTWVSLWLLAPTVVLCGLAGVALLARRHDGRQVLAALGGAQLAMLAASAVRFWPFGPTRTNLFLVPLIVLVVVAGAADLIHRMLKIVRTGTPTPRRHVVVESLSVTISADDVRSLPREIPAQVDPAAGQGALPAGGGHAARISANPGADSGEAVPGRRPLWRAAGVVVVVALVAAGIGAQVSSAARDGRLYEQRDRLRGLDLTIDAAIAARRLYRPGDLVVVGGRLMRPGWIYAMEASDDAPRRPAALPARTAHGEPARIPRPDTLFFSRPGEGEVARDVAARSPAPRRVLLFVFEPDVAATRADLADLRRAGWCPSEVRAFPLTGTLTTLVHCH
ncbi:hypothetical protein BL253_13115 [Pseudofrankia asymbiotica]|uniref:Glycosyltransferase RgtA/B/C/D-like domain-containing protein n=1 Tax=Pseudofrankia asymbiotica TaxID=1834516 RepID=A0A1V2ICT9_9ACTN|nr:hypothetical protein BL253_13115 [Pseudofrankia asymbiotica]